MLVGLNANIDVLAMIEQMYAGTGKFVQMLIPPDYLMAIKNGIDAPDFKTKQKWTQSAMKLMTHKHCLFLFLFVLTEFRNGSALFAKPRISGDLKYCFVDTRRYMER
jgi:hypothetical protein